MINKYEIGLHRFIHYTSILSINSSKGKVNLNNTRNFSSCFNESSIRLHNKIQSVNGVQGNNTCLL
jgi:hypothetical protein